jgi:hypothetical protein
MAIDAPIAWGLVFDEIYRLPGASAEKLAMLEATLAAPVSDAEAEELLSGSVPAWEDPRSWPLPRERLPRSYLSLLAWSDGGEFRTGERWFQFLPSTDPRHGVRAILLDYHVPMYMPGVLPIAFNGGGVMYFLDLRQPTRDCEPPILCAAAGNLDLAPDSCMKVAPNLLSACRGTVNVEALLSP